MHLFRLSLVGWLDTPLSIPSLQATVKGLLRQPALSQPAKIVLAALSGFNQFSEDSLSVVFGRLGAELDDSLAELVQAGIVAPVGGGYYKVVDPKR